MSYLDSIANTLEQTTPIHQQEPPLNFLDIVDQRNSKTPATETGKSSLHKQKDLMDFGLEIPPISTTPQPSKSDQGTTGKPSQTIPKAQACLERNLTYDGVTTVVSIGVGVVVGFITKKPVVGLDTTLAIFGTGYSLYGKFRLPDANGKFQFPDKPVCKGPNEYKIAPRFSGM